MVFFPSHKAVLWYSFLHIRKCCGKCSYTDLNKTFFSLQQYCFLGHYQPKYCDCWQTFVCASITARSFFNHQKLYLQSSILSVWSDHQIMLLSQLRNEGRSLIIGGDWLADSPGHSAILGSQSWNFRST